MKIIIVLGMHNTGTSLVAEGLHRAGCPMYGRIRNRNWEDPDVLRLNDDLMALKDTDWRHPVPANTEKQYNGQHCLTRITDHIEKRHLAAVQEEREIWGMKDPRFIWTWDYWYSIFQETGLAFGLHVIAIKRDVDATARSAAQRWVPHEIGFWQDLTRKYYAKMQKIMEDVYNEQ